MLENKDGVMAYTDKRGINISPIRELNTIIKTFIDKQDAQESKASRSRVKYPFALTIAIVGLGLVVKFLKQISGRFIVVKLHL